jgi:general secretion pathway protein G
MRDSKFSGRIRDALPCLIVLATSGCASTGGGTPTSAGQDWLAEAGAFDLDGSALVIHSGGWDELFSDPRDAGLRGALALLDERLLELPDELGGGSPPPGTVEFLCEALSAPWTLRVDLDDLDLSTDGPFSIRAEWTFQAGSAERASALAARFAGLVALFGLPTTNADDRPGLSEVETPAGSLFHGAPAGGTTFLVAWGEPREHARDLGTAGLPAGVRPGFVLGFDLGASLAWVERMLPAGVEEEEAEEFRDMLELFGLQGDVPVRLTVAAGHGSDRLHIASRYVNWTAVAEKTGALAAGPIPREVFGLIPDDATVVSISRGEPTTLLRILTKMSEADPATLAQLEDALGLELGADLLEPLGQTFGFYLSDSTGGGDLTSGVVFAEVDDEARLATTLDSLAVRLNELAATQAKSRMRLRRFEHGGAHGYELDFPGLPLPLSPSLALSAGHLFLAATPQALAAALDHASPDQGGAQQIASSAPSWVRQLSRAQLGSTDDLQALLYLDAPRLARSGYGLVALLASSIANGVRSPADPEREPGLVLPPFPELFAGVQPTVMLSRVQAQDLVTVGSGDRSALVHLAATLGWAPTVMSGIVLAGALAAVGGAHPTENVEEPEDEGTLQAQAEIQNLLGALEGHASEHDGQYPDSLEELLQPDEEGLAWLAEIPLDPWGNPYFYEVDGDHARIYSFGADGVPGGEGADADVDSDALWSEEDSFDSGDEGWMEEEDAGEAEELEDDE